MTSDLYSLVDAADALTQPIRNTERIFDRNGHGHQRLKRVWITNQPSLLVQLHTAMIPGEVYSEDQTGAKLVPRSIPPARLEAINALLGIENGAALWCDRLRLRLREDATGNIRAIVGAQTDSDQQAGILADLRRWYGWAATLTGWQTPPLSLRAPCPLCDDRALRVRLDRKTATCVSCGEAWTEDTIGLLGEHVRRYTAWSEEQARGARERWAEARRAAS